MQTTFIISILPFFHFFSSKIATKKLSRMINIRKTEFRNKREKKKKELVNALTFNVQKA